MTPAYISAMFDAALPHIKAREAALNRADEREFGPTVDEGEEACCVCGAVYDEGDLWHAGGDGDPTCTRCIVRGDIDHQKLVLLLEQAIAVLAVSSQTAAAEEIIQRARTLLDG